MTAFHLLAGLGNPGSRYAQNRHNIGFQVLDELATTYQLDFARSEHHAATAHGTLGDQRVILAKPQTWMNESGKAIQPLSHFYKIPPERILVIYDDLDIPLGTLRYRQAGSDGGHRGLSSIIQRVGTREIPRLRLGIGRPPGRMDAAAYVLQDFSTQEQPVVWDVLRLAKKLIVAWLTGEAIFQQQGITWQVETDGK